MKKYDYAFLGYKDGVVLLYNYKTNKVEKNKMQGYADLRAKGLVYNTEPIKVERVKPTEVENENEVVYMNHILFEKWAAGVTLDTGAAVVIGIDSNGYYKVAHSFYAVREGCVISSFKFEQLIAQKEFIVINSRMSKSGEIRIGNSKEKIPTMSKLIGRF